MTQPEEEHAEEIMSTQPADIFTPSSPSNLTEWLIYFIYHVRSKPKYRPSGYWRYVIGVYKNLFLSFYFNWFAIVTSPLSSLAFLISYPIISGILLAFELGLKLFMDGLGGSHLVKLISRDYGSGFGMINWGAPELLLSQQTSSLVRTTIPSLSSPPAEGTDHRHRVFDISIAQAMTVLASLVYERDDDKVTEAYRSVADLNAKSEQKDHIESSIRRLVWESEAPIRHIAHHYGLQFAGVTELKSLGGPFCGLYWSNEYPVIIVSFKGTTPTNYSEFLVDATLQRTDARAYLFGSAHEGFYDSLFPAHSDDEDGKDPYFAIQTAVVERAKQIRSALGTNDPVQLWVTGHSLGAAMGSLLFARWLKCPEDIEPYCCLRDCYVLGTPAVGDSDFASMFASYSNAPLKRTSTLWRVINRCDIICRIPPGYNNMTIGHYAPTTDFFNYSHIGHAVEITHPILNPRPLKIYPSSYQSNMKVSIVPGSWKGIWSYGKAKKDFLRSTNKYTKTQDYGYSAWAKNALNRLGIDPISLVESFYPFFIRDHIPIHYFKGLERARAFYNRQEFTEIMQKENETSERKLTQ
ncbi:alpha/beta-hydrolase [Rhizopus microsporus var. microsporus]|uniref:Alpha/beta-hydrolase n=2 Tax=Rhizopus microsporus TaxID=58291 RepID=A0A2G4SRQ4_RHIZD|nr:alpha/beta-hydrolase [Rhizopus microsporus ATCC 52813]ORE03889.1 alpha/beta-hydrolase [Rhizopus microsporus var. microsporus]PHZ11444.1 alpha/beta-hydrolase [Rhizopus microsporus ATCC 52813]